MTSLSPVLLEQLLAELSTLASVYHKPPESFVGKGRFGADEIQRAAIQEQRQNAAENPIAASVAAAAANGAASGQQQSNIENLLDIDFDGAAPASQEQNSASATPDRMASPAGGSSGGMADMMSMFDAPAPASSAGAGAPSGGGMNDLMNGFEGLNFGGQSSQPLPAAMQLQNAQGGAQEPKKDSDDLLGLL
jgi:AP-1 complex subunit beta-1